MTLSRDDYIVQGVPYSIREVPGGDARLDDSYGKVCWGEYRIYIESDGPWEEKIETLIHETMHIIHRGMDCLDITREDSLRWFSAVLVDTLVRNGILVQ